MKTPHKYADVIKAWADGATVQYYDRVGNWVTLRTTPSFDPWLNWRVKPDDNEIIVYARAISDIDLSGRQTHHFGWVDSIKHANLELTFNGSSGELKYASVL